MRFIISLLAVSMIVGVAQAEQTTVTKDISAKPATEAVANSVEMIEATTFALRGKPFYKPNFTQFNYVI